MISGMTSGYGVPGWSLTKYVLLSLLILLVLFPLRLQALTTEEEVLRNMGVDEKLNNRLPLDLSFTDLDGKSVKLGKYFTGGPVVLSLNYYTCPMLCPLTFRNLIDTMQKMQGLSLNKDFRIVTVSFDPDEKLAVMQDRSRETYGSLKGITDPKQRWTFLMGTQENIKLLTSAVGFRYMLIEKGNFAHPSAFIILTPDGRVARYLYGIEQRPQDLKLALIEAADGKIGGSTIINKVLLYCFHYDPVGKKYAVAAVNLMKITGGVILAMLVTLIVVLKRSEKRKPDGQGGS